MFTKDIVVHYGGREKFGERRSVHLARVFIVFVTLIAYFVALYLKEKQGIFEIAVRYAFSGFAAMSPVMVAALFWKRSTQWGALAATLFVGGFLIWTALVQIGHKPGDVLWQIGEIKVFFLNPRGDVSFWNGFMTVVPMVIGSSICVILFSLLTRPPSPATIARYFDTTASHASN
jgi:SSS family solute:Na+ symporter